MVLDIRVGQGDYTCIECEYVVDVSESGEVIGVEFIDYYGFLLGARFEEIRSAADKKGFHKLSFDEGNGCIYLKLKDERSIDQRVVQGSICKDANQNVVAMWLREE